MSANDPITAARRSEQAWWEQICTWESLEYGVAFTCERYPTLAAAQQLRDVWLAEATGAEAFDRAEAYFTERGLTCGLWSPASGQTIEPVAAIMNEKGWQRESLAVLGWTDSEKSPSETEHDDVRILPARAMRRAYRSFLESLHTGDESACDAAFDRLDDASYEVLLAVRDGAAIARIGYHEVGEFARLQEFSCLSAGDDDAIRRVLVAHFLLRAKRMLPRAVVACVPESSTDEISFLQTCGFVVAGQLEQFRRPA
jgi:hypothetical protein